MGRALMRCLKATMSLSKCVRIYIRRGGAVPMSDIHLYSDGI